MAQAEFLMRFRGSTRRRKRRHSMMVRSKVLPSSGLFIFLSSKAGSIRAQTRSWRGVPGAMAHRASLLAAWSCPFYGRPFPAIRSRKRPDISRALPESNNDQLCCGNFGCIDVLHTAGTLLDRLQLSEHARGMSKRTVERHRRITSAFYCKPIPTNFSNRSAQIVIVPGPRWCRLYLIALAISAAVTSILMLEPSE